MHLGFISYRSGYDNNSAITNQRYEYEIFSKHKQDEQLLDDYYGKLKVTRNAMKSTEHILPIINLKLSYPPWL